tara:strand:+ start:257 stop:493 length:237 start_codon:yes stop_codon:yes gene_type:complete
MKTKQTAEDRWLGINEQQIGGDHYLTEIQPWDFIIANNLSFLQGNIIKYICRYNDKGGVEDLYKADHYLKKLIETEEK